MPRRRRSLRKQPRPPRRRRHRATTATATPIPTATATAIATETATVEAVVPNDTPSSTVSPTPPAGLPPTVEFEETIYVFDEVEPDVEIEDLDAVAEIDAGECNTVYVEPDQATAPPSSIFLVSADGSVVASYLPAAGGVGGVPNTGSGPGIGARPSAWDFVILALLASAIAVALLALRLSRPRPPQVD